MKWFKKIVINVCFVLLISELIATYVVERENMMGTSMEPTLMAGDVVLSDKLIYHITGLNRYDLVVFQYLHQKDRYYLKRVIGLPGETVEIRDGAVLINGEVLTDDVGLEPILDAKRAKTPIALGADEYFVLGDNRNDCADSRDYDIGNVTFTQIRARVFLRIYPMDRFEFMTNEG